MGKYSLIKVAVFENDGVWQYSNANHADEDVAIIEKGGFADKKSAIAHLRGRLENHPAQIVSK